MLETITIKLNFEDSGFLNSIMTGQGSRKYNNNNVTFFNSALRIGGLDREKLNKIKGDIVQNLLTQEELKLLSKHRVKGVSKNKEKIYFIEDFYICQEKIEEFLNIEVID